MDTTLKRIIHLLPGDLVFADDGACAVYLQQGPHPVYPSLQLVTLRRVDGAVIVESLPPGHEIDVADATSMRRERRLHEALDASPLAVMPS